MSNANGFSKITNYINFENQKKVSMLFFQILLD